MFSEMIHQTEPLGVDTRMSKIMRIPTDLVWFGNAGTSKRAQPDWSRNRDDWFNSIRARHLGEAI